MWCGVIGTLVFHFTSFRLSEFWKEGRKMRRDEARLHDINEIDAIQVFSFIYRCSSLRVLQFRCGWYFRSYVLVAGRGLQ